jgi:hypothetical protein
MHRGQRMGDLINYSTWGSTHQKCSIGIDVKSRFKRKDSEAEASLRSSVDSAAVEESTSPYIPTHWHSHIK